MRTRFYSGRATRTNCFGWILATIAVVTSGGLLPAHGDAESATRPADEGSIQGANGPQPLTREFPPLDRAFIVPVKDEITDITRDSIRRRFELARSEGVKLVILELDTPGGMVTSTLEICNEIRRLQGEGVGVYAWVNDKAYSGGTIIALATHGIIMSANATIGDSEMILMTPSGVSAVPDELQAKMTSPLIAELRDSARRNGYSIDLVMAFVRPELEVYWVENAVTGQRRFVSTAQRDELFKPTGEDEKSDWQYVKSAPGLPDVPRPIDGARELLTLRTVEALAYGLAIGTADNERELSSLLNVGGAFEHLPNTWMESIAGWLASPAVRGVLFLVMLMCAYAELKTPGFGVAGGTALVALALFLGAPYAAGFTVTWEIVVILLGIVLLVVEAFVIPGFGIAGIAGLILLAIGLIASFVPKELPGPDSGGPWPTLPLTMDYLRRGLWALAGGTAGSLVGMYMLAKVMHKVPVAGRLIAPNPTRDQVEMDDPYSGLARIGHIGRTEGTLRPAGKARFGAILVDVVSDGEYIPADTRIEVVERAGNRVVVRRVD